MKINVEGAEREVLVGGKHSLKKVYRIILQTHLFNGKKTTSEIKKILQKEGFKVRIRKLDRICDVVYGERSHERG